MEETEFNSRLRALTDDHYNVFRDKWHRVLVRSDLKGNEDKAVADFIAAVLPFFESGATVEVGGGASCLCVRGVALCRLSTPYAHMPAHVLVCGLRARV